MPLLKYAVVERERRYLLSCVPDGLTDQIQIRDRYVTTTRLRLREVTDTDGVVTRKLGHKVRLGSGAAEVACTSLYLDEAEWDLLTALPADCLTKTRARWQIQGLSAAVDVFESGLILAEYDRGDGPDLGLVGLEILAEVTHDERFTGAELSRLSTRAVHEAMAEYGG